MLSRRCAWALIVALGVAIRGVFLLWSGDLEPWSDEGQYLYLAVGWSRFGFYLGSPGWVWPPGYPAFLAFFVERFGEHGPLAAKAAQVAISGVLGTAILLMTQRLFSARAAAIAGLVWALYLPLILFTHTLWPETPFLALLALAIHLFLTVVDPAGPARHAAWRLAAAGLCLGATVLLKESSLPLLVLLPLVLLFAPTVGPLRERIAGGALLCLAASVVILPATLRNWEVYGRVAVGGATLGENLYQGVNAAYVNWDYSGPDPHALFDASPAFRWLAKPPEGVSQWPRSEAANTLDASAENTLRALRFVGEHPGFYLRSRIKKLADWATPLSFFVRHQRNGVYHGSLASPAVRGPLVILCVLGTLAVLFAGTAGLFLAVPSGPARWTLLAVVATSLSSVLVVSMSRYRVMVEPFLIVAAAGLVCGRRPSRADRALAAAALCLLVLLWLLNAPEVIAVLRSTL